MVNKIWIENLGQLDDFFYVQIGLNRRQAFANQIGFVRFDTMYLLRVLLRIDAYSSDVELSAGPKHSDSNFA